MSVRDVSGRVSPSGMCLVGEMSVGDVSGRGSVHRGYVWPGKCLSGKCPSVMCSGILFYFEQSRPLKGTSPHTVLQPRLSVSTRFFTGAFYIQKITVDIYLINFKILIILE